jgi:hypothetical protein
MCIDIETDPNVFILGQAVQYFWNFDCFKLKQSVDINQSRRRNIPQDVNFQQRHVRNSIVAYINLLAPEIDI